MLSCNIPSQIPIDFIENMSRYSELQELLENFVEGVEDEPTIQSKSASLKTRKQKIHTCPFQLDSTAQLALEVSNSQKKSSNLKYVSKIQDGALRPKPAECMPELTSVEIAKTEDPTIMFLPCCTRIERCGGCCRHPKLECRPVQTETVNFLVNVAKLLSTQMFAKKIFRRFTRRNIPATLNLNTSAKTSSSSTDTSSASAVANCKRK